MDAATFHVDGMPLLTRKEQALRMAANKLADSGRSTAEIETILGRIGDSIDLQAEVATLNRRGRRARRQ